MAMTTLPRKIVKLNVAAAQSAAQVTGSALKLVGDSVKSVVEASRVAGKTVVGQGRSALDRTVSTATSGVREVSGQAEAQGARVAKVVDTQANGLVDRANNALTDTPHQGTPYEKWTRAQLVERAKELDVAGRSSMSKQQLISALRR